jgi:hypothetical protein
MAITVKHKFVSAIPDDADTSVVRPSNWNDDHDLVGTVPVANGGTGAATLTGYVKGNGTSAMTAVATVPSTDITGLGTMSTQNANAVAITGGTATLTSVITPIVQATNSAGLALKNSAGTTQISMGAGGGDNASINVSTNINGVNAQIDISPTGTGHVHIKPAGTGSLEIAPTNVGTIDNMTIGATTARNASVVDLSVTGTTSFDGAQGTAGQVLTSAGAGNTPTWATPTTGTVTSITAGTGLSGGTITTTGTIAIDSTVATLSGTQTFTNKRVTSRIGSNGATTSGNITPTSDTADQYNITGLTGTSAIQIPSGTPTDAQRLSIRIKDNGTGRTLSWVTTAGGYRVIGTTLPLTTTANKTIYVGCVYNSADSFWDVVAVASEV